MKQTYVLGFVFSDENSVVLIKKEKPDWQRGFLNGVGGKLYSSELPVCGMVREYHEEAGVWTTEDQWKPFCELENSEFCIYCFMMKDQRVFDNSMTMESEQIIKLTREMLHSDEHPMLPNINWLIHLALDPMPKYSIINY